MQQRTHHLAQLNVALMRAPIDDPLIAGFVAQLDHINAVAERSPGFVWRLKTEDGDATAIRAFDDPMIIVNMTVWDSVESLHAYVYRSDHVGLMRDRKKWFERMADAHMGLWWIPAGHIPGLDEAKARLEHLRAHGPSPFAFTFRECFPRPGEDREDPSPRELEPCDWAR
jgi:hypothetical protein